MKSIDGRRASYSGFLQMAGRFQCAQNKADTHSSRKCSRETRCARRRPCGVELRLQVYAYGAGKQQMIEENGSSMPGMLLGPEGQDCRNRECDAQYVHLKASCNIGRGRIYIIHARTFQRPK